MKYRTIIEKADGTRIPDNEPVFILRAQDALAPIAVRFYADLVQGATDNRHVATEIRDVAALMASWQPRKLPD